MSGRVGRHTCGDADLPKLDGCAPLQPEALILRDAAAGISRRRALLFHAPGCEPCGDVVIVNCVSRRMPREDRLPGCRRGRDALNRVEVVGGVPIDALCGRDKLSPGYEPDDSEREKRKENDPPEEAVANQETLAVLGPRGRRSPRWSPIVESPPHPRQRPAASRMICEVCVLSHAEEVSALLAEAQFGRVGPSTSRAGQGAWCDGMIRTRIIRLRLRKELWTTPAPVGIVRDDRFAWLTDNLTRVCQIEVPPTGRAEM